MNCNKIFSKTIAQGMDDKILQAIQITIWIKEVFMDFLLFHRLINNIGAPEPWWRSALFECSSAKKEGKKILKPKNILKRHHNAAAVMISQPNIKTNKCLYYCDFLTI